MRGTGTADKLILFLSCFIYSFPAFFTLIFTLCAKNSAYFRIRDLVFTQKITQCAKNSVDFGEHRGRGEHGAADKLIPIPIPIPKFPPYSRTAGILAGI